MKFIQPSVEYWPQTNVIEHIAKVGRICYKTKGAQPDETLTDAERAQFLMERDKKRCKGFWDSGHKSMYRHGSVYFFVPNQDRLPGFVWGYFDACPYMEYTTKGRSVWISTNMQFLSEQPKVRAALDKYWVEEQDFIKIALDKHYPEALLLLRMTLVVTTQRIQGESYNRKSPNAIAEQSTRYVNLNKKGGVMICRPHWEYDPIANFRKRTVKHKDGSKEEKPLRFLKFRAITARWASHFGYWIAEKVYQYLLWCGLKPEDARGNLTFNTYTICGYTYNLYEWKHIMDMRLRNLTGVAHKDAHIVAEQISEIINNRMRQYIPDFEI